MPIYEFHCGKCQKDSELLVRSNRWKGTKCPHCGSTKLSKNFSLFASSAGNASKPASACVVKRGRSCGCHCAGGKHKH